MTALTIKSFGGISPRLNPRYLQDNQAQTAINCPVFNGPLSPLPGLGAPVATLPNLEAPKSIYRFGQDVNSDALYWFSFNEDVDVCRGQVAGDQLEWTFYTHGSGNVEPRATNARMAVGESGRLPASWIKLGVPAPRVEVNASVPQYQPDQFPAEITLDPFSMAEFTTHGIEISTNNEISYTEIALPDLPTGNRAAYIKGRIDAAGLPITTTIDAGKLVIATTATGPEASVHLKARTSQSTSVDTTGTPTTLLTKTATGTARPSPVYAIPKDRWSVLGQGPIYFDKTKGDRIRIEAIVASSPSGAKEAVIELWRKSPITSASQLATLLQGAYLPGKSNALTITAYEDTVVITAGATHGINVSYGGAIKVIINRQNVRENDAEETTGADIAGPARIFLTRTEFQTHFKGKYASVSINGEAEKQEAVSEFAGLDSLSFLPGFTGRLLSSDLLMLSSKDRGVSVSATLKAVSYPTTTEYKSALVGAFGAEDQQALPESRVYAYSFVRAVDGFEFESGPSPASNVVNVYPGQEVTLTGFETAPAGYDITSVRVYRSVSGTYLFVDEHRLEGGNILPYVDSKPSEALAEEMVITGWKEPPVDLRGLINLPNGIMAGFRGRDVLFCDPFHPHAWPESYIQTVDYPVVGLGRMDTTLAVLTKGTPYFIQGSHPDSMVVVKSDLEQACVSKRSIVSTDGMVIYASPDGLVMLSPSGSKLLTEQMFDRAQWQTFFRPESIHAYQHDMKYIAFYDNGVQKGGFIYDLKSSQFVLHDIYKDCGFNDVLHDKLFLADDTRQVVVWGGGDPSEYTWRSKKFGLPQRMNFTFCRVEAESYPVQITFYADGEELYTKEVTSRTEFRVPPKVAYDWEVELSGTATVFSVTLAQSSLELANG